MKNAKSLVLFSWDGKSPLMPCVLKDAEPFFDILLFDYSGVATIPEGFSVNGVFPEFLSLSTECKGDIFQALIDRLERSNVAPEYVGLIDDDILISIADINRALHLAKAKNLDIFSPVLTHDSNYSHSWMLQQPHRTVRDVAWVEVMMPFYKREIILAAKPFVKGYSSSWGFDAYVFPLIQKMLGMNRCGLIDAVAASHFRPVSSHGKVFKNGLNAFEEAAKIKESCKEYIRKHHADWLTTDWFDRIYVRKRVYTRWQQHLYQLGKPIKRWLEKSA
jgi:hypothetical protein